MRKALKILAIALGVTLVGIVALTITVALLIDPNDYKDEIILAVKDRTGRELRIEGDLKLSLFPWLGLETGAVELANAPGFGQQPLARVARAGVRVEVLPLLRKELVVDTILLDGLELNLMKNKAGAANWADLTVGEVKAQKPPTPDAAAPTAPAIAALTVGGIRASNGKILWLDRRAGQRYELRALELKSGKIVPGEAVDMQVGFDLDVGDPPQTVRIGLDTRTTLDLEQQTLDMPRLQLNVDELALKGNLKGRQIREAPVVEGSINVAPFDPKPLTNKLAVALPAGIDTVGLNSAFKADLGQQTLAFSALKLRVNDLALVGKLKASNILGKPKVAGELEVPNFKPAALADLLGIELEPAQKNAFSKASLKTRFRADLARDTLDVTKLSLIADELKLSARAKVRQVAKAAKLSGHVQIQPLSLRGLMEKLGIDYATADKRALAKVSLRTDFSASGQHLALSRLNTRLDQTALTGSLTIRNFARPAYGFKLSLNQIDLDRYLPPPAPPPSAPGSKTPAPPGAGAPAPVAIPLDILRALAVQGELRANKLKAFGVRSANVAIKLKAKNGLITLGPNQAKLYGGAYAGKTLIDARGKAPAFTLNETLARIRLGPFLTDAGITEQLSGRGTLRLALRARGLDADAITRTLTGTLALSLKKGELKGVDLQKMINDIVTLTEKAKGRPASIKPKPTDATPFDSLSASFKIKNGIARNEDLRLQGPFLLASKKKGGLWANGKGTADLPRQTINYRLMVKFAEDASRRGTTIPIDIRGSFAEPQFKPDWNALIKAEVKKKIETKKEEKKQELEDKLKKRLKKKFKF
ncbi:MAG: AsmA family protein [Acidiferrobacterales bacterium]